MNGREFETEVLRVARHLWPGDPGGGAELIDGRERDGVFFEEDVIHLLEATTERSEEKAKQDCKKLSKLAGEFRKKYSDRVVKCWFVTRSEPTDRQRAVARAANYTIHAVGFKEFQGKLVDVREYLSARTRHSFGSASNPNEGGEPPEFIGVEVKERAGLELWSIARIIECLLNGQRVVLTADFGAGKSMVLRELFLRLSQNYLQGLTPLFPIHVNLREHSGAAYPDEILERHARIIGFAQPSRLVRAWRAGYVILILDGFDEITSRGFQGKWTQLRELRYRALSAVRELVHQQPTPVGLITAGREFYFDSFSELKRAIGLTQELDLTLNEFSEEQVASLLKSLGVPSVQVAPAWLPKRPLFLATLALKGYLADLRGEHYSSRGDGWNELIQSICAREARISAGLDAETIRRVLERVATYARAEGASGSLSQLDLIRAFQTVCGYDPDEEGLLLLERLPGLGLAIAGNSARAFVDADFEGALGAGDVSRFFLEPWLDDDDVRTTVRPLTSVGLAVGRAILCPDERSRSAQQAIERASGFYCLLFDVWQLARELDAKFEACVSIADLHISHIDISGPANSDTNVYFSQCIIDLMDVDVASELAKKVHFQECIIQAIAGVHEIAELPNHFIDSKCAIEDVSDSAQTNAEILESSLDVPVRVLIVTLRKLYMQAGSARKENAFFRGLDANAQRYVSGVLDILGSEGLASRDRRGSVPIIAPNRSEMRRVAAILNCPQTSGDPIVVRVRAMA